MDRLPQLDRLPASAVVAAWGALNALLAGLLAAFTAAGVIGGAGHGGFLAFALYAASCALVFLIALGVWLGRRRKERLRVPARPAAAVLVAVGIALLWLGLPFGMWIPLLAAFPFVAALILEVATHR